MQFKTKLIVAVTLAAMSSQYALAFELKMPKIGSDSSSSSVDVGALGNQQAELVKTLSNTLRDLTQSQIIMANALGLKAQASTAEDNSNKLKSGDLTGKDDIQKAVTSTVEVNKAIEAELKKGTKLSEDSKAQFTSALVPYGKGAVGMILTGKKAIDTAKALTSTIDLTILSKFGSLIYIAKEAPSLMSTFASTTGQVVSFSKSNGIDTSSFEKNSKSSLGE